MAGRVGSVPASSRSQQQSPEDRRRGRRKGPGGGGRAPGGLGVGLSCRRLVPLSVSMSWRRGQG